ncbi:hypothetical protein B0H14DRAFT_2619826 [Mycena olivaceomarginata]|nr:hypothetical protein B0H14DRAFT_2619826 [Mycena olivaceomarginata]
MRAHTYMNELLSKVEDLAEVRAVQAIKYSVLNGFGILVLTGGSDQLEIQANHVIYASIDPSTIYTQFHRSSTPIPTDCTHAHEGKHVRVDVDRHIVAARRARVRQSGGHPRKAAFALCSHPVARPVAMARAYTARSGEGCDGNEREGGVQVVCCGSRGIGTSKRRARRAGACGQASSAEARQRSGQCTQGSTRVAVRWVQGRAGVVRGRADCGPAGEPGRGERCCSMNERMLHAPARAHRAHTTGGERDWVRCWKRRCAATLSGAKAGAPRGKLDDAGGRGTKGMQAAGQASARAGALLGVVSARRGADVAGHTEQPGAGVGRRSRHETVRGSSMSFGVVAQRLTDNTYLPGV